MKGYPANKLHLLPTNLNWCLDAENFYTQASRHVASLPGAPPHTQLRGSSSKVKPNQCFEYEVLQLEENLKCSGLNQPRCSHDDLHLQTFCIQSGEGEVQSSCFACSSQFVLGSAVA